MSDLVKETLNIERLEPGLILIQHNQYFQGGVRLGGDFIIDPANLPWLIKHLQLAADDNLPDAELAAPPDSLKVYVGGGQRYDPINVNAHNHRDPTAPFGGLCTLTGVSIETTIKIVKQLRALL